MPVDIRTTAVLTFIQQRQPVTLKELTVELGLKPNTVNKLLRELGPKVVAEKIGNTVQYTVAEAS